MALHDNSSDYELIRGAQQGDPDGMRFLVERYQNRCFYLGLDLLNNPDDALDMAQEAFIRIIKNINIVDPDKNFFTFLYRVTMNLCLDLLRKRKQEKAVNIEDVLHLQSKGKRPEENLSGNETRTKIEAVLGSLPETYRLALVLRDLHELEYEDISQALEVSYATARWKVHQARKMFKEEWERRFGEKSHGKITVRTG